ncbi:hypothetical protein BDN72DRAFT_740074, partial [Pluteus cervinus]
ATPFKHDVQIFGPTGHNVIERAMFDDGAMVNAINHRFYQQHQTLFGCLKPSNKRLRMADGTITKPTGRWEGQINIRGITAVDSFEIFQSKDRWNVLIGKPLKTKLRAIHHYEKDEIQIGGEG